MGNNPPGKCSDNVCRNNAKYNARFRQFTIHEIRSDKKRIFNKTILKIPNRFIQPDIFFEVEPKGHYKINDNRGAHCDKRGVDKIQSDA